ncbi:hypothetical protein ACPOL_1306 [Acidisarcina polymorpha]|uniref:Uncharacterized protein n=1 Tax=Acidisarcina polymorpha TaxID=2211140 RepID=A0A2Z5FVX5_9BACT|nr:hypothetical protein ACPOL_1306 [Acidisarcina polymorpha]
MPEGWPRAFVLNPAEVDEIETRGEKTSYFAGAGCDAG